MGYNQAAEYMDESVLVMVGEKGLSMEGDAAVLYLKFNRAVKIVESTFYELKA